VSDDRPESSPLPSPDDLRWAAERRLAIRVGQEQASIQEVELELQTEELERYHARLLHLYRDYQQLFEKAPIAFLTLNRQGAVLRMNERAQTLLGPFEPGELLEDRADPESKDLFRTMLERVGDRQGVAQFEARLRGAGRRRYDASIVARRLVRDASEVEEVLVTIEDRTAYRQTQRALVRSERELRSLLNLAPDGMSIVEDGRYAYVNEAWADMLGRHRARLARSTVFDQVRPTDRDALSQLLNSRSVRNPPIMVRVRAADGAERVVEMRALPIEYRGEASTFLIARDLTERRRMEAQVAQSERLAAVGMLVAGVAHEISNPLTFVQANLDELRARLGEQGRSADDELMTLIEETQQGTSRVAQIVGDLRTFQRADHATAPVDVNRTVAETLRILTPKLQHKTRVQRDLGRVPAVSSIESRLVQVLTNLVTNGAEAMPEGRSADDNLVSVSTWKSADDVCVKIEDNGVGIPSEDLKQIFDPFFTKRRARGGTGLGLAIANSIVQNMGGFISVDSEVGRGSRFVVHLPVHVAPSDAESLDLEGPGRDEAPADLRILIVDDEELTLRALRRAAKKLGQSATASSAREAIRQLEDDDRFDVVITDLVMEDGSGEELIGWIREHRPPLLERVILMTGIDRIEGSVPGDIRQLRKPFEVDEFRRVVLEVAESGAQRSEKRPT
jgi:PAS domain S-box-containing protein